MGYLTLPMLLFPDEMPEPAWRIRCATSRFGVRSPSHNHLPFRTCVTKNSSISTGLPTLRDKVFTTRGPGYDTPRLLLC
jgi:hypothetical protein